MKKIGILILMLLCIFSLTAVYSFGIQRDISENLLRMHIIANSNSEYDQEIKLAVRDAILKTCEHPELEKINECANETLEKYETDYGASVKTERCFVPKKEYKNIILPEGKYDCIKVVLGKGMGENWWCVAYPPLCFGECVTGELSGKALELLEGRLDGESLKAIIKSGDINLRFKIVEEFQRLRKYM